MKQHLIFSALFILILASGCRLEQPVSTTTSTTTFEVHGNESSQTDVQQVEQTTTAAPSCANPTPAISANCQAQVAQILKATVRIELRYWEAGSPVAGGQIVEGTSHATLVGGQYLVTHNHFPISLRDLQEDATGRHVRLDVYALNGDAVIQGASLRKFDIVSEGPETLVLDFREMGQALFRVFGIQSMPLATTANPLPQPGMEVAQINWDGVTTWVDWVRVVDVNAADGVPQLVLDNGVRKGASGGGIFWNGAHVGNNWTTSQVRSTSTGETVATFSVAALNVDAGFAS